jgi:hypothetical protein
MSGWVAGAVVAAGIGGSLLSSDAARHAANVQADAATTAAQAGQSTQLQMFEEGRADTAPWRKAGETALNTLLEKVQAGPGVYTTSPGYQWRLDEGTRALERSAAAKGGLLGGGTGKALTRYGQDYATNDYQNFLANYYASLTPYQSLAGVGQTVAAQNAQQGNQVAANIAAGNLNAANIAGQAQAGGIINQANAYTGAANTGLNNYFLWKYLNNPSTMNGLNAAGVDAQVANNQSIYGIGNPYDWGSAV